MYYFIHIPKTAGTSLIEGLEESLPRGAVLRLYGKKKTAVDIKSRVDELPQRRLDRLSWVVGHQVWYGIHELFDDDDPQYVTFLRSPLSRVVSDYYKILRDEDHELHDELRRESVSLEQFALEHRSPYLANHMTVFLGRNEPDGNHNASMCVEMDECLLRKSLDRLATFSFVGIKATLEADIQRLSNRLGNNIPIKHAHRPAKNDPSMLAELSSPVLMEIAKLNQMDSIVYDYAMMLRERNSPAFS